jgi:hypothetical protein
MARPKIKTKPQNKAKAKTPNKTPSKRKGLQEKIQEDLRKFYGVDGTEDKNSDKDDIAEEKVDGDFMQSPELLVDLDDKNDENDEDNEEEVQGRKPHYYKISDLRKKNDGPTVVAPIQRSSPKNNRAVRGIVLLGKRMERN